RAVIAARRAMVDAGVAARHRLGIRTAAVVAALPALGLRQKAIEAFDQIGLCGSRLHRDAMTCRAVLPCPLRRTSPDAVRWTASPPLFRRSGQGNTAVATAAFSAPACPAAHRHRRP